MIPRGIMEAEVASDSETRTPAIGDLVSHEGCWAPSGDQYGPFKIVGFKARPALDDAGKPFVLHCTVFDNERFSVECQTAELVWLEEDGAWMLPGRLLSRPQRRLWQQKVGVNTGPPAEKHIEA